MSATRFPRTTVAITLVVVFFVFVSPSANLLRAAVDSNGNGIDDVWEMVYGARGVAADGDEDGDKVSNGDEADAGTDPRNANDFLRITSLVKDGPVVTIKFRSQKGKIYRLYRSTSTVNPSWVKEGADIVGDGTEMTIDVSGMTAPENYFRIGATDGDADNDELSDWAEEQLEGFDPNDGTSADPNVPDKDTFLFVFENANGPMTITASSLETEAYEVFGAGGGKRDARIRIRRTGGELAEVTVFFTIGGDAPASQFSVEDESGNPLSGFITIPATQPDRVVHIVPVVDSMAEYPEDVVLSIDSHADYGIGFPFSATAMIYDANDIPAHSQLFMGVFSAERGAATSASGFATIRLNGKRDRALVDMNFNGLSSTQTAAHIHQGTDNGSGGVTNGPVMESLPLGIVDDYVWNIPANGAGANSAQDLIDALYGQNEKLPLYANAHTSNAPGGEIWAFFSKFDDVTFEPPSDPPPLEPLDSDETKRDVVRFLTQATFGPTEEEVDSLYDSVVNSHGGDRIAAYDAWIDAQYAETDTKFLDLNLALDTQEFSRNGNTPNNGNPQPFNAHHVVSWFTVARNAKDQLRKRVAFALSQILVISEEDATVRARSYGASSYFDMLSENADDSYREVLLDVSRHPLMGKYLSHLQNRKAVYDGNGNIVISPDENYAREVMQLFSIGLVMLNPDGSLRIDENGEPIPTYDNDDITEMARVFTGWSFSKSIGSRNSGYPIQNNNSFGYYGGPRYHEAPWIEPMKNFSSYHDTDPKTVLGTNLPGGRTGEQDLQAAINVLFNHPNTGAFVAERLIQRFVTSNPSTGYVYRVAQAFRSNSGNLKATMKAILLDYEARELGLVEDIGFGKQREPLLRYVHLIRTLGSESQLPLSDLTAAHGFPAAQLAGYEAGATQHRFYDMTQHFGQSPHDAPSVFNWFLPDYNPGGQMARYGLVAPEFTITSESQVVGSVNIYHQTIHSNTGMFGRPIYGEDGNSLTHRMLLQIPAVMQELTDAVAVAPGADTTTKERNAVAAVLDKYDLLLCAGVLKARYGSDAGANPRNAIIEACERVWNSTDDTPESTDLREAARQLLYLITTGPDYLIQR